MQWLVTGYSTKMDGICYVVEAEDGKGACEKVAKLEGLVFVQIEYGDPDNGGGVADILYHQDDDIQYHVSNYAEGNGPRRCYEVYYEPIVLNTDLTGVVCW
jgi:hypothetical protein